MEEVKVYIRRELYGRGIEIVFFIERENKRYVAKPMELEFEEHEEGTKIEPTLRIDHFLAPKFLKALAEALDKEGVKTENDYKLQGILEATKKYLEDMRRLVFGRRYKNG